MSGLSDHLKGVQAESPPPDQELEPTEEIKEGDEGEDRSWKEVRGEILRKQEKDKAELLRELDNKLDNKFSQMAQMLQARPDPTPSPSTGTKKLEDMSSSELQAFRSTIDWEKVSESDKADFGLLVAKQEMEERVDSKLQSLQQQQQHDAQIKHYAEIAADRYPELRNSGSDLAREVDARLTKIQQEQAVVDPAVVLNIANEVAITKGVRPQARRTVQGKPAGTRTGPTKSDDELPDGMTSDEQRAALAKRLQRALPKGVKFDLEKIKAEEAEIRKNIKDYEE
jgi:hypothetical protein